MNLIDLFCGCGGFSAGAHEAGFDIVAAVDADPILCSSYPINFRGTKLILADVAQLTGSQVERLVGSRIDGIIGGPPCQGFSEIGRRNVTDPRRRLVREFFRIVREVQPAFFVMENVRGLAYRDSIRELEDALSLVPGQYNVLEPRILDASKFGAATKRQRLFILGYDINRCDKITWECILSKQTEGATVEQAIRELTDADFIGTKGGFDVWQVVKYDPLNEYSARLRSKKGLFTSHRVTKHTQAVIDRFSTIGPGEIDPVGRHPRLKWDGLCPNLRAGTGSDRGSYQSVRPIHPQESRVITVREAARLQGFADNHMFHETIWHSFRMIGNSVSPIIAKTLLEVLSIRMGLEAAASMATSSNSLVAAE